MYNFGDFLISLSILYVGLKNQEKIEKLRSWKNFNSIFTTDFEMILVKMSLDLPIKKSI
jgi:hypothetical protein